ncbi:MAG: isoprenylcysteine carboxylmethyltransferase family protein [Halieaceae bacterium]|nr:isoprenylcysteine carboxylmethyltransferase family protein [Halieaceae bacterium]MCP5148365.1 isoprenylcysteine carboxylmethyltransferase family protein [Pseudomonadales bacterium]MCP5166901.1 isoprenylcysteine carboxylmethyltransferase family protein [Pseudomonadales bacterium]MCP5188161.1 isoprenylcysteine carboxylmethyltransferase family protein [Pseudomonadales bacterium]
MIRRVIYPPVWLLLGLIAVFALNETWPLLRFTSLAWQVVGAVVILMGLLLLVAANGLFVRAGTEVIPFRPVSSLVTGGVYRLSRNPMYLGMALVLLGCALTVGALSALAIPPVFAVIVQIRFIHHEERMLQGLFPEEYPAYCARVRRWL